MRILKMAEFKPGHLARHPFPQAMVLIVCAFVFQSEFDVPFKVKAGQIGEF